MKYIKLFFFYLILPLAVLLFFYRVWRIKSKAKKYVIDPNVFTMEDRYYWVYKLIKLGLFIKRIKIDSSGFQQGISKPSLYVANHKSNLDPLIIYVLMYKYRNLPFFRFISKIENKRSFYYQAFQLVDTIFIDRSDIRNILKIYDEEIKMNSDQRSIILFIEGKRIFDVSKLGDFMPGSLRIAYNNHVPVIPLVLYGVHSSSSGDESKVKNKYHHVVATYLKPIKPSQFISLSTTNLVNQIYDVMNNEYQRIYKICGNDGVKDVNRVYQEVDKLTYHDMQK